MNLDDQSIAESFVPPHGLSVSEKEAVDAELVRLRNQRLGQMSEQQKIYADLLRLRYQIEEYSQYGSTR